MAFKFYIPTARLRIADRGRALRVDRILVADLSMDALNHLFLTDLPWPEFFIALAAGGAIYVFFSYTIINNGEESALDFNISVPEQCGPGWQGKLLDEPSIRVFIASIPRSEGIDSDHGSRYQAQVLYNAIARLLEGCWDGSTQLRLME